MGYTLQASLIQQRLCKHALKIRWELFLKPSPHLNLLPIPAQRSALDQWRSCMSLQFWHLISSFVSAFYLDASDMECSHLHLARLKGILHLFSFSTFLQLLASPSLVSLCPHSMNSRSLQGTANSQQLLPSS